MPYLPVTTLMQAVSSGRCHTGAVQAALLSVWTVQAVMGARAGWQRAGAA